MVHAPIYTALNDPQKIALTFDDGPSEYTELLLEVLRSHDDTKVTFFLLGQNIELQHAIVRKIHAAGHAIGNHSYSHKNLSCLNAADVTQEIVKCDNAIKLALGTTDMSIGVLRAPYGDERGHVLGVASSLGLTTIHWSANPCDYLEDSPGRPKRAESMVKEVSELIDSNQHGEIVLFHDGYPPHESKNSGRTDRSETVRATERLLEKYLGKRQFVPLGQNIQMAGRNS